jgi:pimeloyl-ACP methyl ester carboxylesterase
MATYVLIPGAASDSWYWHRVVPELEALGHEVIAVDLPCEDDSAGLEEYVAAVVEAVGDRRNLIVVAQSFGGFTGALAADRLPVELLVLVNAMVAAPGESPGEWWTNTNHAEARKETAEAEGWPDGDDVMDIYFHDVPPDVVDEAMRLGAKDQSGTPLEKPMLLDRWPDVPTRFLLSRQDRFFPADFMRRQARDRLGITADEMDGGHLVALSRPNELVDRLEEFRREAGTGK